MFDRKKYNNAKADVFGGSREVFFLFLSYIGGCCEDTLRRTLLSYINHRKSTLTPVALCTYIMCKAVSQLWASALEHLLHSIFNAERPCHSLALSQVRIRTTLSTLTEPPYSYHTIISLSSAYVTGTLNELEAGNWDDFFLLITSFKLSLPFCSSILLNKKKIQGKF